MFYKYKYQKATADNPFPGLIIPRYLKLMPTLLSAIGLGFVGSVTWPIVSYQFNSQSDPPSINRMSGTNLISPLVDEAMALSLDTDSAPIVISDIDYSKASNWFTATPIITPRPTLTVIPSQVPSNDPGASVPQIASVAEYFSLSIPSLEIEGALVKVNGEDLAKSLVHFPGTSLPGEFGSPVIFGHSSLPQWFKSSNYMTIFATLPTIKVGADVFVTIDKVSYTYRVAKMYEVKPEDTWALRQDYGEKSLKLITCVPPGTRLKRLIIEAKLIPSI